MFCLMDGLLLASGVGSLVVAGFCYAGLRKLKNVFTHLEKTENLDVGKSLVAKVKNAPNATLDYIAIRGNAVPLESTLNSRNVPSAKLLIQCVTVYEHKMEWERSTKLWQDAKRTISSVVNHVPFSLNSTNSKVKVTVQEPMLASGLMYNRVYDKYEPLDSFSASSNIVQWVTGEKTKGIQTVEDGLLQGTTLTAVGKVTFQNGVLQIKPPDNNEYFLSKLPLEGIIREKKSSFRIWKYFTIVFGVTGAVLLLVWLYRKWPRRPTQDFRAIPLARSEADPGTDEDQLCVVCFIQRRNVVILDCGHICACRECASQVNYCPVCRAEIVRLVPTYQS